MVKKELQQNVSPFAIKVIKTTRITCTALGYTTAHAQLHSRCNDDARNKRQATHASTEHYPVHR